MAGEDSDEPVQKQVARVYILNGKPEQQKIQIYSFKDDPKGNPAKMSQASNYELQEPQTKGLKSLAECKQEPIINGRMPRVSDRRLLLDALFTYFYIGPFTVVYWFSTWLLQLNVLFKDVDQTVNFTICAAFGLSVPILASIAQDGLSEFTSRRCLFWQLVIKRLYTYIVAFACVSHWRVVWEFLDEYTGVNDLSAILSIGAPVLVLGSFRCLGIFLAPPAVLSMDVDLKKYFTVSTYFNQKPGTVKHVLDSAFSVVILHSLMVSIWRGTWVLFDLHLRPDDLDMSAIYSLIISFSMAAALLFFRGLLIFLSAWLEKRHFLLKLLFEDIVLTLHFIYVVLHWRGIWMLMDAHFLEAPLRYWVCHFVGFAVMNLSFAANSILARGIVRDGSMHKGEGLRLNIYYTTSIQAWCQRKQQVSDLTSPIKKNKNDNNNSTIEMF